MNNDEYIKTENRIKDGSINEQSIWSCVKERNSYSVDSLLRTALIDCTREYTYRQMFALWDKYAGVFSALGMTEENGSRVGIAGTISAEPLFAFYGLNMTGVCVSMLSYPDFLPSGQWKKMVEREKLTDLLLSDIMISPEMWPDILAAKEKFGIRNIILLHSKLGGPCAGPAELIYNEVNYHRLKGLSGVVYMDDLLRRYDHFPVQYGSGNPDKIAVITHTSGSTKGIRKPLPYAERSVNVTAYNMGPNIHALGGDKEGKMQYRYIPSFDFSSFLCMCGVINSGLAASECVVLTFFGFMHPKFIRAVKYYNIDVMLVSGFMVDNWIKKEDDEDIDLSSVKIFSCGGSYISVDRLKRYYEFVRKHGYDGDIMRGYGMSETGGAELTVPMGCMDDILGFPTPKENFLVRDMEDDNYYTADDGVRTGTMYVASDSLCTNELDGEVLFEYTVINGRNYLCSNDLVRVNEDGSFSYAGRADRFFVNNEGVSFDAGRVEAAVSKYEGVEKCAIVPVLDKRIHDTVPALYLVPDSSISDGAQLARKALLHAYIDMDIVKNSVLPTQLILVKDIPCNSNGKIDVFRITRDRLKGESYDIVPVKESGILTDIEVNHNNKNGSITAGTLPEGMEGRSAFNLYDLFNS